MRVEVFAKDLGTVLDRCRPFLTVNERHPEINRVECRIIETPDETYTMVMTCMSEVQLYQTAIPIVDIAACNPFIPSFLLPWYPLPGYKKSDGTVVIEVSDNDITLEYNGNKTSVGKLHHAKFINYNHAFPRIPGNFIWVNPTLLIETLKAFPKNKPVRLGMFDDGKPITVQNKRSIGACLPMLSGLQSINDDKGAIFDGVDC